MKEDIKNNTGDIAEVFKNLGNTFKSTSTEFSDLMMTIAGGISTFESLKKAFDFDEQIEKANKRLLKFKNELNDFGRKTEKALNKASKSGINAFKKLTDAFNDKGIKGVFDEIGQSTKDFGKKVENLASDSGNKFKKFFADIKEGSSTAFGNMKKNASSAFSSFKSNPFSALSKAVVGFGAVAAGVFSVSIIGGIALAVGAIAGFVAYFNKLMETNEEFREKITALWEGVGEAFQPAIDAFGELFACLVTGKESLDEESGEITDSFLTVATSIIEGITSVVTFFSDMIIGVVEFIKEILFTTSEDATGQSQTTWDSIKSCFSEALSFIQNLFETVTGVISELWELFGDDIIDVFSTVWSFAFDIISGAVEIVSGIFDVIVGIFTGNGEKIKEGFKKIWEGIKGIFGGIGEFFSGIWDKVVSIFKKVGTKIGDAIGGAFKTVINAILSFAEGVINGFIKAINFAIKMINLIPGVNIKKLDLLVIPKLADGGMLHPGQVFIAREAGPELVGTFGSRTAVMNNNQIVQSVSRGVYDAVRSAMGSGSGSYTFNITNTLDGREIGKQVIKYHNGVVRQTGVSPLYI